MNADCRRAISASGELKLWDVETGFCLRTLKAGGTAVAMTADGRLACSASNELKVWGLETGVLLATFTGDAPLQCCAFVNNSAVLAGDAFGHVHYLSLNLGNESPRLEPAV
jgi:WD40 repeat protein